MQKKTKTLMFLQVTFDPISHALAYSVIQLNLGVKEVAVLAVVAPAAPKSSRKEDLTFCP